MLLELRDAVVFFNRQGRAVKLEGLGTYTPSIDLEGQIKVGHRADNHLKRELNDGDFRGDIERRENVGKTSDDLVTMWNDDNPDDPVT